MLRIKNYDSTGVAPNGRLYAGDLNALQDGVAALTDLTQSLSLGAVAIGESGLQLVRYGANEARISGSVRTDGILRALGGVYAGAFTTAQRDGITPGTRPYGLVILNTTNNRLEINLGTDATPSWVNLNAPITKGLLGARSPAASSINTFYFATDDSGGTLYNSDGSTWTKVSRGLTEVISAAMVPAGAIDDTKVAAGAGIQQSKLAILSIGDGNVGVGGLSPNRIAGTAVINSDGRLSDPRPPSGAAGGVLAGSYPSPSALAANVVGASQIVDNSVGTAELGNGVVTAGKQANGTFPVRGTTVNDLRPDADGKIGMIRMQDGTELKFMHDAGYWYSDIWTFSGRFYGPVDNGSSAEVIMAFIPWVWFWNCGFRPQVRVIASSWSDDPNAASGSNVPVRLSGAESSAGNDILQPIFSGVQACCWITSGWENFGDTGWYTIPAPGTGRTFLRLYVDALANWYAGGTHTVVSRASLYVRWINA